MTDEPAALDAAEVLALRELLDRSAIQQCINVYFHALDSRDFSLLDQVFAPEIDVADGVPPMARDSYTEALRGVERFRVSHHGPRNSLITVDATRTRAHSDTYAMDHLIIDPGQPPSDQPGWPIHDDYPGPVLRSHGLRYVDDFERRPEGWRIVRRRGPIAFWRHHSAGVEVHPEVDDLRH
jgi:hypothetical protein